jgi:hypothetical protein
MDWDQHDDSTRTPHEHLDSTPLSIVSYNIIYGHHALHSLPSSCGSQKSDPTAVTA